MTNFRFGDSLLSSNGEVEHMLSSSELEAIQNQFMTAEHPVVPLNEPAAPHRLPHAGPGLHLDQNLSQLVASLKSGNAGNISPELSQRLSSAQGQQEEMLKELASNQHESLGTIVSAPPAEAKPQLVSAQPTLQSSTQQKSVADKKKSLIVYLNHPRPDDMSRAASSSEDSLAQLISEQTSGDPFVSAKEFDSHGLSKETKHLDVSSLRGLGGPETKELTTDNKDGLSVVVIGDAYKYKKIVLLISSKSGGLKFIPMVKDMRRR